jgi:hypothetical protein
VAFLVDPQQLFEIQMRVFLGGSQAFMTQQFLYSPQVRTAAQQMGGEGMSEGMRADPALQGRLAQIGGDHALNGSGTEPVSPVI